MLAIFGLVLFAATAYDVIFIKRMFASLMNSDEQYDNAAIINNDSSKSVDSEIGAIVIVHKQEAPPEGYLPLFTLYLC